MSDDIELHPQDINRELTGILLNLSRTRLADNFDSLSDALHQLGMWDFVFNEAECSAYQAADIRLRCNFLHPK